MCKVPYGQETLSFSLPLGMKVRQAVSKPASPLSDEKGAVEEALANPVGTFPLHRLTCSGDRVCVVFTDITRSCPDNPHIPPMFQE